MPICDKTRLIRIKIKELSPLFDGTYMIKHCLVLLVDNFRKYAVNMNNVLYVEVAEVFDKNVKQARKNMNDSIKKSKVYKNYTLKEFLIEKSLEVLEELEENKKYE